MCVSLVVLGQDPMMTLWTNANRFVRSLPIAKAISDATLGFVLLSVLLSALPESPPLPPQTGVPALGT